MEKYNNDMDKYVEYNFNKLFKLMIDKGVRKKALAEAAGIPYSSLSRLANNQLIKMDSLVSICRVLNCGIEDIMEYTERTESEGGALNQ